MLPRLRQAFGQADATRDTGVDTTVAILAEAPSTRPLDAGLAEAAAPMHEARREDKGRVFAPAAAAPPIIGAGSAEPS